LAKGVSNVGAIAIYDATGRRVRDLAFAPGETRVVWDGTDEAGLETEPGVYFLAPPSVREAPLKIVKAR
jgi:hypothetical protein